MKTKIGVDRATGKIVAFAADHVLHGGGLANLSPNVATVGACAALGIYYVPKADITTVVPHSRAVTTGSMRGYGTLQTMTALEVQVDEICAALPLDPIEFRRRNALEDGGRTMTGNPYIVSVRTPEILDKLEKHPIWQQRAAEKARGQQGGKLVGTGVACATKDYGTGADATLARVDDRSRWPHHHPQRLRRDGNRASAPRSPIASRLISAPFPTRSIVAQTRFLRRRLDLSTSGDPYTIDAGGAGRRAAQSALGPRDQLGLDRLDRRARRDPSRRPRRPASCFRFGLWPAALELWGIAPNDPKAKQWEAARWKDGQLTMPGLAPLASRRSRQKRTRGTA